jgi:phosphoribosylaminoimidazole-succinocarboxamide synthase
MPMPSGLKESEKLPQPMFTPSTKAELGQHDENIHPDQCTFSHGRGLMEVKEIIGPVKAARVEELALALYTKVPPHCNFGGLIIGRLLRRDEGYHHR